MYTNLTLELRNDFNPDENFSRDTLLRGISYSALSEASTVTGYTRHFRLHEKSSGKLCMDLSYNKSASNTAVFSSALFLRASNCPGPLVESGDRAMAFFVDQHKTDTNVLDLHLFVTGDADKNGTLSLGSTTSEDEVSNVKIRIDRSNPAKIVTTIWAIRVTQNSARRLFLRGQDGTLVYMATGTTDLNNTSTTVTGFTEKCINLSTGGAGQEVVQSNCTNENYSFNSGDFPNAARDVSGVNHPNWTHSNFTFSGGSNPRTAFH